MFKTNHILLASHGTQGAQAAVQAALSLSEKGSAIFHLTVVPTLWKGMTGDDWLNNGSTRNRFRRYLESELGKDIDEHCDSVEQQATSGGVSYNREIVVGEPVECLINCCKQQSFDLVIIGSPRPKGMPGLRSRMKTETLAKSLSIPLLVVPFPDDE